MENNQTINEKNLKGAIVSAVAFFDMFDFPLTAKEIWQFVFLKCELADVQKILLDGDFNGFVEKKNGFYFLSGREEIIETRMRRYNFAGRKFKRALLISRLFKAIPWIKMIAVGNILGANNLKDESDIDFFVVTEKRRIWVTRFFCVVVTKVLNLRPKEKDYRDKICLSFFVSENAMNLEKLMLNEKDDIYFVYWLANLVPIYNRDNIYENFISTNPWFLERLPNWHPIKSGRRRNAGSGFSSFYHDIVDLFLGGLESNIKRIQLKIMPNDLKNSGHKDNRIVINDEILKFHKNDRRAEYRNVYIKKLENFL